MHSGSHKSQLQVQLVPALIFILFPVSPDCCQHVLHGIRCAQQFHGAGLLLDRTIPADHEVHCLCSCCCIIRTSLYLYCRNVVLSGPAIAAAISAHTFGCVIMMASDCQVPIHIPRNPVVISCSLTWICLASVLCCTLCKRILAL